MNLKNAYRNGTERLRTSGVPEPELDAWYLLEYVTGIDRASYYADPDREMTESRKAEYDRCIEARSRRIPLQHITGEQEFMGLTFHVNSDVLIPRQDTETLVETALDLLNCGKSTNRTEARNVRLLDMCTGSGCIMLRMLH